MSQAFRRRVPVNHIDLASIRDTLLYIQSDVEGAQGYERLADSIRGALAEVEAAKEQQPERPADFTAARFVPAALD